MAQETEYANQCKSIIRPVLRHDSQHGKPLSRKRDSGLPLLRAKLSNGVGTLPLHMQLLHELYWQGSLHCFVYMRSEAIEYQRKCHKTQMHSAILTDLEDLRSSSTEEQVGGSPGFMDFFFNTTERRLFWQVTAPEMVPYLSAHIVFLAFFC